MRACITGGAGFIGSCLVRRLQRDGMSLRLLTRTKSNHSQSPDFFVANLCDTAPDLNGLFDDVDMVFHCAGEIRDPHKMRALHVQGTMHLLRAAAAHIEATGKPLHWIQLSSVGAYGPAPGRADTPRVVTEMSPEHPRGEYETTKTEADHLVLQMARDQPLFTCSILRPSIVIGATMTNQSVRSLVKYIRKNLFFYIGSRTAVATYVHVDDVVEALYLCGTDPRARGQIFNLSNDCLLSEIVNAVSLQAGIQAPNLCVPERAVRWLARLLALTGKSALTPERIDALIRHTGYPNRKIVSVLGYTPRHGIAESIATMFNE